MNPLIVILLALGARCDPSPDPNLAEVIDHAYSVIDEFVDEVIDAVGPQPLELKEPDGLRAELGPVLLDINDKNDEKSEIRPLQWGDINFLHTTDTHGWLPGHVLEPQFSADWGDYISFVHHMRAMADRQGIDLLVVDSGDRHDGNGFSDATDPDGDISERVFIKGDFDVVTIGNHELYHDELVRQEHEIVAKELGEKYLTSNVDILLDDGTWVPVANRYRYFTTKNQGLKVMAFGFLFDFTGNCPNSRVTRVADAVQQDWFQDAIRKDVDLFLVATHIPARYFDEMQILVDAIRAVKPSAIIQAFAGHSHIRDYTVLDDRATALQSGRFLETVGFASIRLGHESDSGDEDVPKVEFGRSYIDFNVRSLSFHSNTSLNPSEPNFFYTPEGDAVTKEIIQTRQMLNLTDVLGCVPQSYYTNRAPFPGPNNIFSLMQDTILPMVQHVDEEGDENRTGEPRFILTNTGSIRYDLVKGPFTKDTGYIVSPFPSQWYFVPSVNISKARQVKKLLNSQRQVLMARDRKIVLDFSELGLPNERVPEQVHESEIQWDHDHPISLASVDTMRSGGYVTYDDLGHDGDDTPHKPWPYYHVPNVIQAETNVDKDSDQVDIVFNAFMRPFMEKVFEELDLAHLNRTSFALYNEGDSVIDLLPTFFSVEKYKCY
uniref:ARAD1D14564p n=1 Tax=Blastobotrys adeninivorans TaxID=409370 RepID=A0A060T9U7_BLAAD